MKKLSIFWHWLAALALAGLAVASASAQMLSPGAPTGLNAAFVKLFGPAAAFTAKMDTIMLDRTQRETVRMPAEFAALDGKVRLELNLAQMTSDDLPAGTIAKLKQAGMDRVVSIFRPDKKVTYTIYPGIQSYVMMSLPKEEAEASANSLKLEKTALGKETLDGHACMKNKATVKRDKVQVLEAVTWNATDMKDFPLQIEMKQKDNTVRMHFSGVQLVKPDAKVFEVPANYGLMK